MLCWVSRAKSKGREGRSKSWVAWKSGGRGEKSYVQVVRSQVLCLLKRLSQFGPGVQEKEGRWDIGLKKPGEGKHRLTTRLIETGDCVE